MSAIIKLYSMQDASFVGYLKSFDPDVHHPSKPYPTADLRTTLSQSDALRFAHHGLAFEFWRQQSHVQPLRPDGQPNRPLTAYHAEIIEV
jgi:hypothetical protein